MGKSVQCAFDGSYDMRVVLSAIVLFSFWCVATAAEKTKSGRLAPGDQVEVQMAGESYHGEVVAVGRNGWVQVRVEINGTETTPTLPPNWVKRIPKSKKSGKSKGGATPPSESEMPAGASTKGTLRTWKDKSGKFSVSAKFLEIQSGKVRLEQEDGTIVGIPLGQLSDDDRKAAESFAKEGNASPFSSKATQTAPTNDGSLTSRKPDEATWSAIVEIVPNATGPWSVKPDPPTAAAKKLTAKPVGLYSAFKSENHGAPLGSFNNVASVHFSRDSSQALIFTSDRLDTFRNEASTKKFEHQVRERLRGVENPMPSSELLYVQRVDLTSGRVSDRLQLPSPFKPLDVDPAGRRILLSSELPNSVDPFATPNFIIWELADDHVKTIKSWGPVNEPSDDPAISAGFGASHPMHRMSGGISSARFIDAGHILAVSKNLIFWNVDIERADYKIALANKHSFALSPGRKYVAVAVLQSGIERSEQAVFVLDPLTGKTLGRLKGEPGWDCALSFDPSGRQLVAVSPDRVVVWNLESGDLYRDVSLANNLQRWTQLDWVADGYLLVGGSTLIDLERRIVLWQYQVPHRGTTAEKTFGECGGAFWYALTSADNKERGLFRATLPHEDARKVAHTLDPDQLLALKPGAQVSLKLQVSASAQEQQQITQFLTEKLNRLGMEVVPGSRLVFTAKTESGQSQSITYRRLSEHSGNGTTMNVTTFVSSLTLTDGGTQLWQGATNSGVPLVLNLNQGKSMEQAVAEQQKPNFDFFRYARLPQYLARTPAGGAYGASVLTHHGVEATRLPTPGDSAANGGSGRGQQPNPFTPPGQAPPQRSSGL